MRKADWYLFNILERHLLFRAEPTIFIILFRDSARSVRKGSGCNRDKSESGRMALWLHA